MQDKITSSEIKEKEGAFKNAFPDTKEQKPVDRNKRKEIEQKLKVWWEKEQIAKRTKAENRKGTL